LWSAPASAEAVVDAANPDADVTVAEFFQGHFILMSDEEKKQAIARLEKRYSAQYGKKTTVSDAPAPERVLFGYALDISKCIGCRRCVHACVKENNQSRHDPEVQWIQVMKMPKGNISFTADQLDKGYPEKSEFGDYGVQVGGNAYKTAGLSTEDAQNYYTDDAVPDKDFFYMPVQCQQCEKPPCVKACPVRATFRDHAGVVLIDYNWCIGCRMCQLACPYQARHFNWGEDQPSCRGDEPPDPLLWQPAAHEGRNGKMHILRAKNQGGQESSLFGGLPGGRKKIRQSSRPRKRCQESACHQARLQVQGRGWHLPQILLLHRLRSQK